MRASRLRLAVRSSTIRRTRGNMRLAAAQVRIVSLPRSKEPDVRFSVEPFIDLPPTVLVRRSILPTYIIASEIKCGLLHSKSAPRKESAGARNRNGQVRSALSFLTARLRIREGH